MHLNHKFLKGVGIALLVPIILVLLLVVAVYLPPIQRWAVDKAADTMGQKMGLTVSVGSVRLTPFLDLRLQNVTALDEGQDTVLHTTDLLLDVAFAPLFEGRADIDGFRLRGARVDTKSFVPDAHISGRVGELSAAAHGVAWKEEKVHLDRALLADADLQVTLSDTAKKDTTSTPAKW
ncbi:MAG: phage tail protein, partial [Alloprevotella sp.]